jgi:hypothetical protein
MMFSTINDIWKIVEKVIEQWDFSPSDNIIWVVIKNIYYFLEIIKN